MKKYVYLTLLITVLLTGCFNKEKTIVIAQWSENEQGQKVIDDFIEQYNENHEFITLSSIPLEREQLSSTDFEADIVYVHPIDLNSMISNKKIYPIDKFVKKDEEFINNFNSKLLDAFKKDDKLYAVPKDFSVMAMMYNKDFFDTHNLDYPENITYNELTTLIDEINKIDNAYCILPHGFELLKIISESNGVSIFGENALYDAEEYSAYVESFETAYNLSRRVNYQNSNPTTAALVITPSFYFTNIESLDDYTITTLPESKMDSSLIYTVGFGITRQSKNKKEAYAIIKELTTTVQDKFANEMLLFNSYKENKNELSEEMQKIYNYIENSPIYKIDSDSPNNSYIKSRISFSLEQIFRKLNNSDDIKASLQKEIAAFKNELDTMIKDSIKIAKDVPNSAKKLSKKTASTFFEMLNNTDRELFKEIYDFEYIKSELNKAAETLSDKEKQEIDFDKVYKEYNDPDLIFDSMGFQNIKNQKLENHKVESIKYSDSPVTEAANFIIVNGTVDLYTTGEEETTEETEPMPLNYILYLHEYEDDIKIVNHNIYQ